MMMRQCVHGNYVCRLLSDNVSGDDSGAVYRYSIKNKISVDFIKETD